MRLALGASRGRLIQQLLTEASLLAVLAGGGGLLASWFAEWLLETSVAASLPPVWGFLAINVNPDIRVFAYTLTISLVTGILFGLAPALEASTLNLASVWKEEGASFAGKLCGRRLRRFFIAAQVAICLVLLIAAGLLARGSARAVRLDPGFETKKILALDFEIPPGLGYDSAKMGATVHRMVERFKTVPGVKEVAEGRVPLGGGLRSTKVFLDPSARQSNAPAPEFYYSYVSPNYFETLTIPIVRGRAFTAEEARASAPVTVISEATAAKLWPGLDSIGKHVTLDASKQYHGSDEPFPGGESFQVIGVSRDMRSAWLNEIDPGFVALPLPPAHYGDVMVRAQNDPNGLMEAIGREAKTADPNVIVYAETMDRHRAAGAAARCGWHLRHGELRRRPAHPRGGRPHGAGGTPKRRSAPDPSSEREARCDWPASRTRWIRCCFTAAFVAFVRHQFARPRRVRRRFPVSDGRSLAGLLPTGASGDERGPDGGAEIRVERSSHCVIRWIGIGPLDSMTQ